MQDKDIKNFKVQASLLGRHLQHQHGCALSQAQLLECLAALNNAPDWNALAARPAKRRAKPAQAGKVPESLTVDELLAAAVRKGATAGQALSAFARKRGSVERAYLNAAKNHVRDGELEVDDNAAVSVSSDNGAYVQAWLWVEATELSVDEVAELEGFELQVLHVVGHDTALGLPMQAQVKRRAGAAVLLLLDEQGRVLSRHVVDDAWTCDSYQPGIQDAAVEDERKLDDDAVGYVKVKGSGLAMRVRIETPRA